MKNSSKKVKSLRLSSVSKKKKKLLFFKKAQFIYKKGNHSS